MKIKVLIPRKKETDDEDANGLNLDVEGEEGMDVLKFQISSITVSPNLDGDIPSFRREIFIGACYRHFCLLLGA